MILVVLVVHAWLHTHQWSWLVIVVARMILVAMVAIITWSSCLVIVVTVTTVVARVTSVVVRATSSVEVVSATKVASV